MKISTIILPAAMAGLLWSCTPEQEQVTDEGAPGVPAPAAPSAEVLAELEGQAIGSKLLGNTVMLSGDAFTPADLVTAPDYYLVYYSASW